MSLWLAVIACLVAASSLTTANPSGSCASINYSTKCCPPGGNCNATDGPCHCGSECHRLEDCCTDVFCPESKILLSQSHLDLHNNYIQKLKLNLNFMVKALYYRLSANVFLIY